MFYSHLILTKKGPLGKLWMAATLGESKIPKSFAANAKIHVLCQNIEKPAAPFALRLSASLMLGVVRVYSKKSTIILTDVNAVLDTLNRHVTSQNSRNRGTKRRNEMSTASLRNGGNPLPDADQVARFETITLPVSKKRRTRTYAFPTRSETRSQASRATESLPHPSSSYLQESGQIDVLRAMETLFPSVPVPNLGAHLRSGLSSPSSGYRSQNQRLMLYKARDQDITLTAPTGNLDNAEFAMFDEDLPVSHESDPSSISVPNLMLEDAEEFAAAFGSQRLTPVHQRREAGAANAEQNLQFPPELGEEEHPFLQTAEPKATSNFTSLPKRTADCESPQQLDSHNVPQQSRTETPETKTHRASNETQLAARSAAKRTKRIARLYFDTVTELPPSHIRSCLSDVNDIVLEDRQSRGTETRSRRSRTEMDFFSVSGVLSQYPQQIVDLWRNVTADAVKELPFSAGPSNWSPMNQGLRISLGKGSPFSDAKADKGNSISPVPWSDERGQAIPLPLELEEELPAVDVQRNSSSDQKDVPSAEVLRGSDGSGAMQQPNLGSISAPTNSVSGPSSRTFSIKSAQFHRDTIFEDITAADQRAYEEACQALEAIGTGNNGASNERIASHSQDPSRGHARGADEICGNSPERRISEGDERLEIQASDFQLVEETEKLENDEKIGRVPIERIGIRGYKILQMLRNETGQQSATIDRVDMESMTTTFEELTVNCSRGARARTFFHVLNLISSGFLMPAQQEAYGTITLTGGKFF